MPEIFILIKKEKKIFIWVSKIFNILGRQSKQFFLLGFPIWPYFLSYRKPPDIVP
jgi:hypothetical protein